MIVVFRLDDLISLGVVARWEQLRHLQDKQGFPPGRTLTPGTRFWTATEIVDWINSRPEAAIRDGRDPTGGPTGPVDLRLAKASSAKARVTMLANVRARVARAEAEVAARAAKDARHPKRGPARAELEREEAAKAQAASRAAE
jgi:hypothetical protein